jgi:hypothetical protein
MKLRGRYFRGYTFHSEQELVPGAWTVEFYFDQKKMAEKAFTVYKP